MSPAKTVALWWPTGPEELALVKASGWLAWPPRPPEQPIFHPVLNEDYAIRIARDWNVPASGVRYVARFDIGAAFAAHYPVQQAGGRTILELWVPAEESDEFNRHIVGRIEVVHGFRPQPEAAGRRPATGAAPGTSWRAR
ncbi:ADP-ribosylation/crystallin J1 [Kitasatospora sp. HPMI-4]|uniref:ADP-ribosylation/crystallin J1 n=1 Tax=Kitasatospora sp. HPMI-4 TaxID=3448443 RepID=UPI003F1D98F7